jgi:hypothetical protein
MKHGYIYRILFFLCIILIHPFCLMAQKNDFYANGKIAMVNRMDESRTRALRTDKPLTIRTMDGKKIKGICYVESNSAIYCEKKRISLDSIYSISGLVTRNSKEKAAGVGLGILSIGGAVYPLYLIIGGLGLGDGNALFVGITLLSFDLILMYAAATLTGIYPRRFNLMNWGILVYPPGQIPLTIPQEMGSPGD